MEWVTGFIAEIYSYLEHRDDTSIDRLNRLYTVALLSACVTIITSQQYVVGGRIICWTPKDFTGAHVTYAQNMCWLGQTNYYVSQDRATLEGPSSPRAHPFPIYPWLPIVLIGMTASFAAPYLLVWRGLSTRSGIDINRLLQLDTPEKLTQAVHYILTRKYSLKKDGGVYVMAVYLFMRSLYIVNLIGQIVLVNKLLTGYRIQMDLGYLFEILSVKHNMWSSAHLPIETMCDFMVRMLGDRTNWYTVQCILPFNLFTKRILALLLLWFSLLLVVNVVDLLVNWLWRRICSSSYRHEYVFRFVHLYESCLRKEGMDKAILLASKRSLNRQDFVHYYLGLDGYFLLKSLQATSSDMEMGYLVGNLFRRFLEKKVPPAQRHSAEDTNVIL